MARAKTLSAVCQCMDHVHSKMQSLLTPLTLFLELVTRADAFRYVIALMVSPFLADTKTVDPIRWSPTSRGEVLGSVRSSLRGPHGGETGTDREPGTGDVRRRWIQVIQRCEVEQLQPSTKPRTC